MEEIRQLKADKTKEKGSQHDLEHVTDKEETSMKGISKNAEQRFITMAEVVDVHEIYTIKYSHIYIISLTFMLFYVWLYNIFCVAGNKGFTCKVGLGQLNQAKLKGHDEFKEGQPN